jgi:hypothetical protein
VAEPYASIWGDICVNCDERWALPADRATCIHKPICEDCWPNGCNDCEWDAAGLAEVCS